VARTRRYKRAEKNFVLKILHLFGSFFALIGRGISALFRVCDRKLTIMIVPHSQSKVVNFQTNIFSLVLGIILFSGVLASFLYFNQQTVGSAREISRLVEENRETMASLDELRDENNNLLQAAKRFQSSLSQTLSLIGVNQVSTSNKSSVQNSDLSSLFDLQEISKGSVRETADIRQLVSYLEGSIQPIEQIGKMLETQSALFADTPSIWPVRNGLGHISMAYGQNIHPITGQWYIHKGMDISTWRSGDPILATANGQVVTVTYDNGMGNYVIIKHKYGYYTRYAHMETVRVKKGQFVSQGNIIGTIGSTGLSTGAHLHYEVHIGSEVVDPAKYVNVKVK
jgi:murein DD-endopeptidase MepM/ murein hydrolase activator NlpD